MEPGRGNNRVGFFVSGRNAQAKDKNGEHLHFFSGTGMRSWSEANGVSKGRFMNTVHAWFSQMAALRLGSTVYRQASGSMVNVTRTSAVKESEGLYKLDEKYLGEVIEEKDGGGVGTRVRVGGITR